MGGNAGVFPGEGRTGPCLVGSSQAWTDAATAFAFGQPDALPSFSEHVDTHTNYSHDENDAIRILAMLVERRWQQVFNEDHPNADLIKVQMERLNDVSLPCRETLRRR